MLSRVINVLVLLCIASAARASDPLTKVAIDQGTLFVRPKAAGLEVRFLPGPNAPRKWSLTLLSPKGASSAEVSVAFPPGHDVPLVVILPRPTRDVPDTDLRLRLVAPERDLVGLVGPLLEAPRLRLLGDSAAYAGTTYAPRVVVTVPSIGCVKAPCERPLAGAKIVATLSQGEGTKRKVITTATAVTDTSGSAPLAIVLSRELEGELALALAMTHDDGIAEATQALKIVASARVLVSTDKPLYQPGQTLHLRLLAKDRGTGRAKGKTSARFMVFDAKNNKVFQQVGKTSPEGVFAASMEIASLVNTGRWRITAKVGDDEVERTVEVKPYVLPKFKVEVAPDRTSYRPGETVKGSVSARYFFGEPLRKAKVELAVATFDVGQKELVKVTLKLDDVGAATFEFKLPETFVGQPMLQGGASVMLTAQVTDTAGQSHEGRKALTIYEDALRVMALPEAGRLIPGVDNAVFFIVTTPDGQPARAKLTFDGPIGSAPGRIESDANGIAEWHVTPPLESGAMKLDVVMQTAAGVEARHTVELGVVASKATSVLLRPSNMAPRAGEQLQFDVLVQGAVPHVFVDLIKDQQTLVTLSAAVKDGRATITTTLAPELAGTVLAHAYVIGNDMEVYADTRPLVVRAADELKVEVVGADKTWRPGEDATIELRVTDAKGHPVLAAMGLWAVDEAVFALSELQPGMEQIFFLLEQEIMRPKVEVHGLELDAVFRSDDDVRRPAAVLAAAAMPTFVHALSSDSRAGDRQRSQALWQAQFEARAKRLRSAVRTWVRSEWRQPSGRELHRILRDAGTAPSKTRDWFGVPFEVDQPVSTDIIDNAHLKSAGPDAVWNTGDDLVASLEIDEAMQPVWEMQERREVRRWARGDGVGMALQGVAVADELRGGGMRPMDLDDGGRPAPMVMREARPRPQRVVITDAKIVIADNTTAPGGPAEAPRIRSYFPETLYVNPLVMSDASGRATVTIPMADSITTWRLSALASTDDGRLGSSATGLRVFQDFFVDIAFPASLTRNDQVTVPVAIYNYLPEAQTVELTLAADGGLKTAGEARLKVTLGPNEVKGVQVPLEATRVGMGRLTVTAKGTRFSDAVRREVRIEADGFPVTKTESGMVTSAIEMTVDVPEGAIEAASVAQLKLYPGMFSQVVDGLENMLRMPSGCFEQTSSTTYPNILVLRYLRDTKKSKPELEATALRYLQAGWQRLVTYEVPGGGFSWFGNAPANKVLTGYGLMEFEDMDKVYGVDRAVIARTRGWLVAQQRSDGSFAPDQSHLHAESWGDMQKSTLLVSAYLTWSLAHTRPDRKKLDAPVERGLAYLKAHLDEADDAYVLGYIGNAFAEAGADRGGDKATLRKVLAKLAALAVRDRDALYFPTKQRTVTYGGGDSATIEVTALALRAFMRGGEHLDLIKPGLNWLTGKKDAGGNWSTTQATIQVLQAFIGSLSTTAEPVVGAVEVQINGQVLTTARYGVDDFDVVRFIDASKSLKPGKNTIRITPTEGMKPMFQLTSTAYLPWGDTRQPAQQAFDVKVEYDRTTLAKDDIVGVRVEVRSNLPGKAEMGIVDVAVPPGFEVLGEDLERAVADGVLQRFTLAGRQIILYVPQFTPDAPFVVTYRVRARFPIKAGSGGATVYEYYNPDNNGRVAPTTMRVN